MSLEPSWRIQTAVARPFESAVNCRNNAFWPAADRSAAGLRQVAITAMAGDTTNTDSAATRIAMATRSRFRVTGITFRSHCWPSGKVKKYENRSVSWESKSSHLESEDDKLLAGLTKTKAPPARTRRQEASLIRLGREQPGQEKRQGSRKPRGPCLFL
jgi:hypothetical protein